MAISGNMRHMVRATDLIRFAYLVGIDNACVTATSTGIRSSNRGDSYLRHSPAGYPPEYLRQP